MKYNCCPKCRKAYIKSRLEKDRCIYCGSTCKTIDVKRNGLYYLGYGIMLAGATAAFVPRFVLVSNGDVFFAAGMGMVIGGSVCVVMGSTQMARDAAAAALEDDESDG